MKIRFGSIPSILPRNAWLELARTLFRFQPRLIVAYVSSVTMFANYLREQGMEIRPRVIQTSAEVLGEAQRRLLEEVFACPVFNRYGCREVGNIAHECGETLACTSLKRITILSFSMPLVGW